MLEVRQHSRCLVKSMRRLRRKLSSCKECAGYENCPVLMEFNSDVTAAITQITEEWSLDTIIS